jgi:anti-sigma B factor antagonist
MGRDEQTELVISVRFDGLNHAVLLEGELDLGSAPRLEHVINDLAPSVAGYVLLDLEGVSFTDAAGLTAIERAAQVLAGRLVVCGPGPRVREIIELTRLNERIQVEEQGALEVSDIPAGNVAYVRRLCEAFVKGGAEHLVELVPDDVTWKPLGAAKKLRTSELLEHLSSQPTCSLTPGLVTSVGDDVLVTWEVKAGEPEVMWSLFLFHQRRLVDAVSFDSEPKAIAALRLFDRHSRP